MIFGKGRRFLSTEERDDKQGARCLTGEKMGGCQHCKKVEDTCNFLFRREIVVVQFFTPKIREGKLHPSVSPCSTQSS